MKRIATLLCLTHLLTSPMTLASESRLISWKVTNVGNNIITNFDVEKFIEETQISDSLKISLFKKANKDYSVYLKLVSEISKENFKDATGKYIYAQIMKRDHQRKHGRKRVAFKTTVSDFVKKRDTNESTILRDLLDQRIGIVKARESFGQYLITKDYPHKENESATEVYMRWYNSQSSRLETEMLLKEVKSYEAYIALKDSQYYHVDYMKLQDTYKELKSEVQNKFVNKKVSHQSLLSELNNNKDWKVVIKDINNSQLDTTSLRDYSKNPAVENKAKEVLSRLTSKNWDKTVSYFNKVTPLIENKYTIAQLNKMAKSYTEAYIQNKSNYSSYMMGLIAKLGVKTLEESTLVEMNHTAIKINSLLKEKVLDITKELLESDSEETLDLELENRLLEEIQYENLSELEKAIVNLSVFSIKFQIKKEAYENIIPVRVSFEEYASIKVQKGLRDSMKYEWMKNEFKSYVKDELLHSLNYMTIRTGEHEYLNPEEKINLILGSEFNER